MIFFVIIIIASISVLLAFWSLRNVMKMQEVKEAKKDLSKSKILYQSDSTFSSSETSKTPSKSQE